MGKGDVIWESLCVNANLFFDVFKRRWRDDWEADEEDVGLWIRQRPQSVVILLAGRVEEPKRVRLAANHDRHRVIVENLSKKSPLSKNCTVEIPPKVDLPSAHIRRGICLLCRRWGGRSFPRLRRRRPRTWSFALSLFGRQIWRSQSSLGNPFGQSVGPQLELLVTCGDLGVWEVRGALDVLLVTGHLLLMPHPFSEQILTMMLC